MAGCSASFKDYAAYAGMLSHVWLIATPWTVARQVPLSMGLPRYENWSGWPFPPPLLYIPNRIRVFMHRSMCARMHIATPFVIVPSWKLPKSFRRVKCVTLPCQVHLSSEISHSSDTEQTMAISKNAGESQTRMSEKNKSSQKNTYWIIPFLCFGIAIPCL